MQTTRRFRRQASRKTGRMVEEICTVELGDYIPFTIKEWGWKSFCTLLHFEKLDRHLTITN